MVHAFVEVKIIKKGVDIQNHFKTWRSGQITLHLDTTIHETRDWDVRGIE